MRKVPFIDDFAAMFHYQTVFKSCETFLAPGTSQSPTSACWHSMRSCPRNLVLAWPQHEWGDIVGPKF